MGSKMGGIADQLVRGMSRTMGELREIRVRQGLSRMDVAKELGVVRNDISNLEIGNFSADLLKGYCLVLGAKLHITVEDTGGYTPEDMEEAKRENEEPWVYEAFQD